MDSVTVTIVVDGGSKGNGSADQEAYYSYAVRYQGETKVKVERQSIGNATSNTAEWTALIKALEYAQGLVARCSGKWNVEFQILTDSQHVHDVFKGIKHAKLAHIKRLHEQAIQLSQGLTLTLTWEQREVNSLPVLGH